MFTIEEEMRGKEEMLNIPLIRDEQDLSFLEFLILHIIIRAEGERTEVQLQLNP